MSLESGQEWSAERNHAMFSEMDTDQDGQAPPSPPPSLSPSPLALICMGWGGGEGGVPLLLAQHVLQVGRRGL